MEKKICKLIPLVGMEWDSRSIPFGCTRETAENVLGAAEDTRGNRCYYFDHELALDFDGEAKLEFIEFLGGADSVLRPSLFGQDAFAADADELLDLLSERNGPDIDDDEAEYSYALRTLSIGMSREITPADVDAMLLEMSTMKLEVLGGVDVEEEMKKAHHWETIGIGVKDYYA